jgi:hypothetical protein
MVKEFFKVCFTDKLYQKLHNAVPMQIWGLTSKSLAGCVAVAGKLHFYSLPRPCLIYTMHGQLLDRLLPEIPWTNGTTGQIWPETNRKAICKIPLHLGHSPCGESSSLSPLTHLTTIPPSCIQCLRPSQSLIVCSLFLPSLSLLIFGWGYFLTLSLPARMGRGQLTRSILETTKC